MGTIIILPLLIWELKHREFDEHPKVIHFNVKAAVLT